MTRHPDEDAALVAYMDRLAREHLDTAARGYRWPEVDKRKHPAHHVRVPVQRRTGPRASRFNDLEQTR